jgi:hypothetical protein
MLLVSRCAPFNNSCCSLDDSVISLPLIELRAKQFAVMLALA